MVLTGTDARPLDTSVRPYMGLYVLLYYNGRSTERPYNRYSLTGSTTDAQIVRPYNRYSLTGSTTDAQIVRPYKGLLVSLTSCRVALL